MARAKIIHNSTNVRKVLLAFRANLDCFLSTNIYFCIKMALYYAICNPLPPLSHMEWISFYVSHSTSSSFILHWIENSLVRYFHFPEKETCAEAFQGKPHLPVWCSSDQNFLKQFTPIVSQRLSVSLMAQLPGGKKGYIVVNH